MREREVYPNAPIVLVAVEVRHSLCEPLGPSGLSRINAALADHLPLRSEVQNLTLAFQAGGAPQAQGGTFPRWSSRDKRTAVTVRTDALMVETTDYLHYEKTRELLKLILDARTASAGEVGVERVGMRYIDEIRVPRDDGDSVITWSEWVHQSLLGPAPEAGGPQSLPAGLRLSQQQGLAIFMGEDDQALGLRYGRQVGHATESTPDLRRPMPPPGPYFLLDIDSFWQPSQVVPRLETERVLEVADRLHAPVREIFESLITERLRREVLRGE
ncbi:MAG: TIGR04255 family protein [Marmoricola sp.]